MKYIIGLGNPGLEYKTTKHNAGFRVVKEIAKEYGIEVDKNEYSSLLGTGRIESEEVKLILPQTYMNLSGKAIEEFLRKENAPIDRMIVICDDINLKLGRIRLRKRGSAGGHKGLASIIGALKRNDFARLKVGIATETHKGDITNYVLTPFKRKDRKHVTHVISLAKEAVVYWLKHGIDNTMARFNTIKAGTS